MAEVLEFPAIGPLRGVPTRPARRPRAAAAGGGMPVIAPVPAAESNAVSPMPSGPAALPQQTGRGRSRAAAPGAAGVPVVPSAAGRTDAGADETMAVGTTVDHLTETYQKHYRSLLGLAALLLDDTASCEDVVQEAFIRVHSARSRVREPEKTLAYLRQTVVNLSRSALRRRILGLKLLSKPMPDMASAEEGAYDQLERDALIKAMRGLQRRQREVLVLRYFADMTEAQVAETLGISLGSVKAYGSRGIAALRVAMEATA
ncbi:SigE family RNA polymerase sigma factor [Streptomyces fuscigenes]|uniref:SigE family RNA polymerase sigma factor n=1 Tax=Streptomyces fuscigenes TaxID=1528880 RepID=UPI001F3C9061|nr:SigE family RNA polymerase sigma factor [Streptomyces fuscigenes]MCF3962939.1 SigE family RNA polymerase sigma factor [Streptomyces fuscigenes]